MKLPRRTTITFILLAASLPILRAQQSESMADSEYDRITERQNTLLAEASKDDQNFDEEGFQVQVQSLVHDYEMFLEANPKYAMGYAGYGYLLWKMGMRKESVALLLKANDLDPNIALVKNEIGNYLAEEGKPLEAVSYYLSAIKLQPKEPLYHYQLGQLLYNARADFIKSGEWTRDSIDLAQHEAFKNAAELAPDRIEFTYRYAESFYDLPKPDWDGALKAWAAIEAKETSAVGRQTARLHAANILIKQGNLDAARVLLATVTEPVLQSQKQKLVALLVENPEK